MILFHRHYGEGAPLVILHGLFGQCDNWVSIAKSLGEKGHSVYCVDLRNHGQSPHSPEFSMEEMAEDVRETLDDLRLGRVHLLGHSMGGKVAMFFAQQWPERLLSLLVIDIGIRYYPPHHQDIISGLQSIDVDALASRNDADAQLAHYVEEVSTRQFLLKNLYRKEDNSFGWRFNLPVITTRIEEVGRALPEGRVNVPTLFYRGGQSRYVKAEEYDDIKKQFPQAEFKTMEDAGHWLHAENPAEFVEEIGGWLGRW